MKDIHIFFQEFLPLSENGRLALDQLLREEVYRKNDLIQQPGARCRNIYYISEGLARIFYYKDGEDITEHFSFSGNIIVRAESLFTGKHTTKGIQALENTKVVAISAEQLFSLYDQHHEIERLFRLIFEKEHVNTIRRVESFQLKNATERYLDLLNETNMINQIPLRHIASYLGITQVSLSRIRASLQ